MGHPLGKATEHLTLTRQQEKLIEASSAIQADPPDRIDFLHTVQCQCGIPYKNPGDEVREWDRKQGDAVLRIEAGSAIDPTDRRIRQARPALRREAPAGADPPGQRGRPHRLARRRCRGLDDRLRPLARHRDQRPAAADAQGPARPPGRLDRPHGHRGGGEGGPGQHPDRQRLRPVVPQAGRPARALALDRPA